jgi:hypothetical protein
MNRFGDEDAGQVVDCGSCGAKLRLPAAKKSQARVAQRSSAQGLPDTPERGSASRNRQPADREERLEEDRTSPQRRKRNAAKTLGRRERTFRPNRGALQIWLVLCVIASVGGVVCLVLSFAGVISDGGVAGAMFLLAPGIGGGLWCLNFLSLKVDLHEDGIVHMHRGTRRVIPWSEIAGVFQAITEVYQDGAYIGTYYKYTLELGDRTRIIYTNYRLQKVSELADEIIERTAALLLPQARQDYQEGKVVNFGPLSVSENGLHSGNNVLQWREVKGVRIKEGYVSVSKRGKWLNWSNAAASSIPNLSVFLALVDEIIGIEAG